MTSATTRASAAGTAAAGAAGATAGASRPGGQIPFGFAERMTSGRWNGTIVWLFNIGAERVWHPQAPGVTDVREERIVGRMEEMNWLLCREQDYLIMRSEPSRTFADYMRGLGFPGPKVLVTEGADPDAPIAELVLRDARLLGRLAEIARSEEEAWLMPYAVTEREEAIAAATGLALVGGPSVVSAAINDKASSRELSLRLGLPVADGRICGGTEEMLDAFRELRSKGYGKVILKEPRNASGKGLYVAEREDRFAAWARRAVRTNRQADARWLVEGWQEDREDWNAQLFVDPSGSVELFSLKRQLIDGTVYIGSEFPDVANPDAKMAEYAEAVLRVGRELARLGYRGVAGIDSMRTERRGWIPVVEINGRFTLSTYLSFLPGRFPDRWLRARYRRLPPSAAISFDELLDRLEREGLLYAGGAEEGVIVYVSGTLPGRLFTVSVSETPDRAAELDARLDAVVRLRDGRRNFFEAKEENG